MQHPFSKEDLQNIEYLNDKSNSRYQNLNYNSRSYPIGLNKPSITPFIRNIPGLDKDTSINILIIPGQNNYKRIDTVPYTFYFSNVSLINDNKDINQKDNNIFNGNKEIKIYSLDKISDKDTKMVVQINSCYFPRIHQAIFSPFS